MFKKALPFLFAALLVVACGKKNEDGPTSAASIEYFYQFVNAENGLPTAEELAVTEAGTSFGSQYNEAYQNLGVNSSYVKMKIDTNGTFFLYTSPSDSTGIVSETKLRGLSGKWRVENDKAVFEGLGETEVFNAVSVITQNQFSNSAMYMNDKCFTIKVSNSVILPHNNNVVYNNQFYSGYSVNNSNGVQIDSGNYLYVSRINVTGDVNNTNAFNSTQIGGCF